MTIERITVENVKGIVNKTFDLNIIPNKPSLLVAPNGFGKSSLAVAFSSLQRHKINLQEDHFCQGDADKIPRLLIDYVDDTGASLSLEANPTANTISEHLDVFVINSQVKARGIGKTFGGRTHVSASMAIEPVILVDTIPAREQFGYSCIGQRSRFGRNGKMLPNIERLFNNKPFIEKLSEHYDTLDRLLNARSRNEITRFKQDANAQSGSTNELRIWMTASLASNLDNIAPLKIIAELLLNTSTSITSREEAYLAALQIFDMYSQDKKKFKNACKYSNYSFEREQYTSVITTFNTSWRNISPKEQGGQLIVEFPKAHYISNGQRDVLSFVALLHRARKKLKKPNSILLIDEVFDYLDDANLIAVQYYITEFIDSYRSEHRRIYPLILTHLNPEYFRNFAFSKQKTYYLDKRTIESDPNFVKLLRHRNDELIKEDVAKYLLHYHSSQINRRNDFRELRLKETWGELDTFDQFIEQQMEKYRNDLVDYDPLAICCAVRKRVEKLIYDQLTTPDHKQQFLNTHETNEKLTYAENSGVLVPEYYYLLGIIYNDGLHWKEHHDNISPIAAKLEHCTINKMIKQLYTEQD